MIYFKWYANGVSPWGGLQAANPPYNGTSLNGRLMGDAYFVNQAGLPAAEFTNNTDPNPTLWPLQHVTLTRQYAKQEPSDRAFGLGFYIPPSFSIPNKPQYITMLEPRFVNIGGHGPLTFELHPTGVKCNLLTGAYNPSTRQYQHSSGVGTAPSPWPIPQGHLVPGAWNYLAWQIHNATDNSGAAEFYAKSRGTTTWANTAGFSGIPTALWTQGYGPPSRCADLLNNYGFAFQRPFTTWYACYFEADTLPEVQALFP